MPLQRMRAGDRFSHSGDVVRMVVSMTFGVLRLLVGNGASCRLLLQRVPLFHEVDQVW